MGQNEGTPGTEHGGRRGGREASGDEDRSWAARMMEEREKRDIVRHEELKQLEQLTQRGVAATAMKTEDIDAKVSAVLEHAERLSQKLGDEVPPTATFDRMVFWLDQKVKKALPYVTVAGAAAAVGYGGYRGVQALRSSMRKRVDVHADVRIQPVGEPIVVER